MTRIEVADGVSYAVRESGEGTPVLLLHGFTGSGMGMMAWLPDLPRTHRTLAVDLLGHGDSDSPPQERHAIERQAADIALILERMDADPAHVLGYSFGARVALRMAIDAPDSIRGLILESPAAGIADASARIARRAADQRWVEQLQRGDMDGFVRDWTAQPIFASQRHLPDAVRQHVAQDRAANRPDGLAASLLGAGQGVMAPLHGDLGRITAPTLVVSGELDVQGTGRAAEVAAGIPGAIHETIMGAGHTPHLETPERFRDLVMSFLAAPSAVSIPTLAP